VSQTSSDLLYTGKIAGVPANWMAESIRQNGLDPLDLPEPKAKGMSHEHLPANVRPWKTLWSAGQGIDLIKDLPTVAELVRRLRAEYVEACRASDMTAAASLAGQALETPAG
jgi:nitronate monooxygenase